MFRASLCPSSGEQDRVLLHMVFCTGCAGCGCVELGRKLCAVHTAYDPDNKNRISFILLVYLSSPFV